VLLHPGMRTTDSPMRVSRWNGWE